LVIAADYPLLNIVWTMLVFFAWVIWFVILIQVFRDLFRRDDASGWTKAAWFVFVIILPFLGVLIYIGVNGKGMAERNMKDVQTAAEFAEYQRSGGGGGGATKQIADAKALLDSGAIDQAEFEKLKAQALAA
jgi:Phospholipase_D-nuclease N-terminal/Short C-terminal domain